MNSVQQISQFVYSYGAQHFSYDRLESPELHVLKDLADSNIPADSIKDCTVLLDFRSEGQCDRLAGRLVDTIKHRFSARPVVLFNTIVTEPQNINYEYYCMPAWITKHLDWFETFRHYQNDLSVNKKFLCLMRRPSDSRARLAKKLVEQISSLQISFGAMCQVYELQPWQDLFQGRLPLLIDGKVDDAKLHVQAQSLFADHAFNIVAESSAQHEQWVWRSKFITEKTFKAFALRQIPLWWAVPGLVTEIRKLGFDLFDDLVCHDYDHESDEAVRLEKLFTLIKNLDQTYTVDQCQELRHKLKSRLDHNFDLLQSLCDQQNTIYNNIISQLVHRA